MRKFKIHLTIQEQEDSWWREFEYPADTGWPEIQHLLKEQLQSWNFYLELIEYKKYPRTFKIALQITEHNSKWWKELKPKSDTGWEELKSIINAQLQEWEPTLELIAFNEN